MTDARNDGTISTSVRISKELHDKFCKRLPKYGDRSDVLRRLIEMFIAGEVRVVLPGKTF